MAKIKNKQPPGHRLTHLLGPPIDILLAERSWKVGESWVEGWHKLALDDGSVTWALSHLFEISMEVKSRWSE